MPELPSGTVTFLFTDLEGSTALWEHQSEAMRLALQYFFHDAHLQKVQLSVYDFNTRAIASYRKCGFEVECVRRNIAYVNGEWCDSIEMAISTEHFATLEPIWGLTQPTAPDGELAKG